MMKKIIQRSIALIMSFVMLISTKSSVIAGDTLHNEEIINELFNKMTECLAASLLDSNLENKQKLQAEIAQIENELSMLGVQELTEEEVLQFFAEKGIAAPRINIPSDTNTVKWYFGAVYNHTWEGDSQKYDVQYLVAVGNNPGGMLVTGEDNVELFSDKPYYADLINELCSIYVQKALGTVKILQWAPYELLFSDSSSSSNAFNSCYVSHRCVSSIRFSYVKKSSEPDSSYSLCQFSNNLSIAYGIHGAAVADSKPTTYSKDVVKSILSDNYSNYDSAIRAYVGNFKYYDYMSYYEIQSCDGEYKIKAYVPNPLVGPGQIY